MGSAEDLERLRKGAKQASSRPSSTTKALPAPKLNVADFMGGKKQGDGGGGKNVFGQIGSVFSALPGGLAGLGKSTWDSTVGNIGATVYTGLGYSPDDVQKRGWLASALANEDTMRSVARGDSFRDQFENAAPILDEIGQSMSNTGGRLVDLASVPFGKQTWGNTKYAKASDESGIVGTLLEDVGNLALGGAAAGQAVGGASRGLAASRAGAPLVGRGGAGPSVWRAANSPHGGLPVAGKVGAAGERVGQLGYGLDQAIGKTLFSPLRIPSATSRLLTGEGMTPRARYRSGKGVTEAIGDTQRYKDWRNTNPTMAALDRYQLTPRSRSGVGEIFDDEGHRLMENISTLIDSTTQVVQRIAPDPVEQVAARLRTSGVADALAPAGQLPPGLRRQWISAISDAGDGAGVMADMTPAQVVDAFDLAIRSVADPDSLGTGQLGRLEQAQEAWSPVVDLQKGLFETQYGILDPRSPETVALLAGDEVLPYEMARVMEGHAKQMEPLLKERERRQDRVDRARGRVRLDDDLIESKGAGLAARGRELDSLAVKLIDAEGGVEYMAELLDPDNKVWTEIPEAKLPAWVRGQVRDRLNGRAMLLDQGQALPADIFSDAVEASGLKALPLEPSQKGRAKVRSQAGQEAVARQAGQDVDRLGRRIDTLEGRADRLADALETAINERPRPAGATKVKAAVKAELKADRAVRSAAGAYARLKNALRDGEVLSTPVLVKAFQDIRKAALPILDEVADNTWVRLEDEYGVRDTVVLGDTHIDDAVRVVEAVAQRTGLDVDQVLGYGPTGRKSATPYLSLTDPDTGRAFGHLVDGEVRAVEAEQGGVFGDAARGSSSGLEVISGSLGAKRLTDGSMDATVAKLVDDISEIINANEMRRWIKGTRKVKQKGGVRRAQATQGGMRAYLSSEMGIDMLDSVLTAMDEDPALVYAAFSDDPVAATRELALEWFDEGWANVPGEASVAAQAALAAADEAAGPQRMLAGGEDLGGPVVKAARDEYIADFDHPEVAGAAFDAAFARLQQGLARKVTEHAASIDPSLRAASQRTARGAGQAGRRLGRMEGETAGLRREQGINERRAARGADDLEGAEYAAGLEQLERGERHGQAEGRRLEKLRFEEAELAKVNRRIASVDAKLAEDLAAAMEKVTSAPANYRVALSTSRALGEVLADVKGVVDDPHMAALLDRTHAEMVTTVVDALDMLNPEYVAGGRLPGSSGSGGGFAPAVNKAKSEYLKDGVLSPMTDGAQMVMVARNLELLARNQMVIRILGRFGKTADGLLGEDAAGLRGDAVVRAIDEASDMPMVAVNPRKPLDARLKPAEIRPDTVFIPRWVADAMDHQFQQAGAAEKLARTFIDAPTRVWKHGVLALSPRWHMGNIVGNVLMAWAAGIPPHRMLALVREAKILTDGGELPGIGGTPGRLGGSGTGVEHQRIMHSVTDLAAADRAIEGSRALEAGMMREVSRGHGPIRNRLQRRLDDRTDPSGRTNKLISGAMSPVQSSYKMNGWVDDFFHNIVYLDEMKKGANPEAAIKQSLKVAGDFSTMTKVERSIVRRALPFYSWMRHITKLSADLAVNHPARVAWNLHLWTLFADDDADFSDIPSLFGSIQTDDDKFIRARSYMPFGSVIDMDPADPFGTLASAASPVFKLPLEIGTGIEAGPGGLSKMSTSSGEFGDRGLKPIGWNATISRLGKLTPQTRAAQELLRGPTDRTVRYGTGEDILKNGRPIPDVDKQSNKDIIMRSLLGLPLPATSDPAAIRARDRQRGR